VTKLNRDTVAAELDAQIKRARAQGRPHVEINAGELHRLLGGYQLRPT